MAKYFNRTTTKIVIHNKQQTIRCMQINLGLSRIASDNLTKLTENKGINVVFVQEPYVIHNKPVGIPNNIVFSRDKERRQAAVAIIKYKIDAIFIQQFSDKGANGFIAKY